MMRKFTKYIPSYWYQNCKGVPFYVHGTHLQCHWTLSWGWHLPHLALIMNRDKITNCDSKVFWFFGYLFLWLSPFVRVQISTSPIDVRNAREYSAAYLEHVFGVIGHFPEGFHGTLFWPLYTYTHIYLCVYIYLYIWTKYHITRDLCTA